LSNVEPTKFLVEVDDGLITRVSQPYALYKLKALDEYLKRTSAAMRAKPWRERYFIDLQAGPGKNQIGNDVYFGSPLIALTTAPPFTQYRFNELEMPEFLALQQRVNSSPLRANVKLYQRDANEVVRDICDEIEARDAERLKDIWPCFNVAFLDPEGLELHWPTIEKLAQMNRMDLIINFSTGGINRLLGTNKVENIQHIDRFFGTSDWPHSLDKKADGKRRAWIDFYLGRLLQFGYKIEIDPEWGNMEMAIKNSKNVQVYSMIFASKHTLGSKFWGQSTKKAQGPKFQGF